MIESCVRIGTRTQICCLGGGCSILLNYANKKKLRLNGESCTRDESRTHTHVMHYDLNVACLPISAPGYSLQIYKFILSFQMTLQILGCLIWTVMTPTGRIKYILQFISKFLSSLYVMPYILILVSSNH